jgi:O-antigen/teichoic acid export membrane protein
MAIDDLGAEPSQNDNLTVGAKGGAVAFTLKSFSLAFGVLNQIVLAKILGANGVGEVILALSLVKISSQIAKFGMEETMMRFVPRYLDQKDKEKLKGTIFFSIKFSFMISIALGLLIFFLTNFISIRVFHSEMLLKLIPVVVLAIPAWVTRDVIAGILKGYRDAFKALLPENLISPSIRLILFLLLTLRGISPVYAVIAFVAGEICAALLSIIFLTRKLASLKTVRKEHENTKVLRVAYTIVFSSLSMFLFTQTDLWILGMLKTTWEVGIYGVAAKLVFLIYFPMIAFGSIIPPIFSSTYSSGNYNELNRVTRESTRWILSMAMPIILVLLFEGNIILRYFYGLEFEAGYIVIITLTVAYLISSSTGLVGYFLQMTGQHTLYMKLNIIFGLLNLVLNLALIARFGILGAAVATAFSIAMLEIVCTFIIYKKFTILSLAKGITFDIMFLLIISTVLILLRSAEDAMLSGIIFS